MPTFEIQRSQTAPTTEVGGVRVSTQVDTGTDALGRAFQQLGQAVGEITQRKQDAANAILASEKKLEYQSLTAQTMRELETVSDQKQFDEKMAQYQEKVRGLRTGVPDVDQDFEVYRNNTMSQNLDGFYQKIHRNQINELNDAAEINIQKTKENGDQATAFKLYDSLVAAGTITSEKSDELKKTWSGDMRLTRAKMMMETGDPNEIYNAETVLKFMSEQASADPSQFNAKQLDSLDNLRTHLQAIKNRKNSESQEQQNKDMWDAYNKTGSDDFTREYLDGTSLDAEQKIRLMQQHKSIVEARAKGEVSFIEEGDPNMLANVQQAIDLNPNSVSKATLYRLTEKGLGTKHVPALVDRLERNLKDQDKPSGRYRAELATMYEKKLFGDVGSKKSTDTYLNLARRLDVFIETNPSESDLREFYSRLLVEDAEWGRATGPNVLPGWDESPVKVPIEIGGKAIVAEVKFGSVIEEGDERWQAVGKSGGVMQWAKFKKDDKGRWRKTN